MSYVCVFALWCLIVILRNYNVYITFINFSHVCIDVHVYANEITFNGSYMLAKELDFSVSTAFLV